MKNLPLLLVLLTLSAFQLVAQTSKMSVDDLLAKHRASIGTAEAIAGAQSRVMQGTGSIESKLGAGFRLDGQAQLASTPKMVLLGMAFPNPTYPYEKVAFDGTDASFGLPSGKTTALGVYLKAQNSVLKDGLFAGALSSSWALLESNLAPKTKLELAGTGKIEGVDCYKVRYSSSRTGVMKVMLYFDKATFRHVRTEYHYEIEPRIGTSPTDVTTGSRVERYDMTEDFSDFKQVDKLTLPTSYKITISTEGQIYSSSGANIRTWSMKINNFYFDQKLTADMFKVS